MTPRDALTALARGEPAGLLQTCRLTAGATEYYGEEEIAAAFRAQPLDLTDADWTKGEHAVAAVGDTHALFADLAEGRIARLWRIGLAPALRAAAVAVAFDLDMAQAREAIAVEADDFPDVTAEAIARVEDAGRRIAQDRTTPARRSRAAAIRLLAPGDAVIGLFAVTRGWGAGEPPPGFTYALSVGQQSGGVIRVVRDPDGGAGAWGWSPGRTQVELLE